MLNKKERMEKMAAAGINTGKYFTLDLPEGLKPGSKIALIINEEGQLELGNTNEINSIREQIISDGYVRNTKLFRRYVMAQMFHMLNYRSWDGREEGYNAYLNTHYGYDYTIDMMIEEVRVLSKLETRDRESFEERTHFFDKDVVVEILEDYMIKLESYVNKLPVKRCKGVPYVTVKGEHVFVEDVKKKVYTPIANGIRYVKYSRNYAEMYRELVRLKRYMVKLPYGTTKAKAWVDAYKGNGAYYTLKNLVMFHKCGIEVDGGYVYRDEMAVRYLAAKNDEYKGEGWRMFALMKKVIKDNNFDFNKRMVELGVK